MTEAELQTLCEKWQKRLRLQDWIVHVVVKRIYDMAPDTAGRCEWEIRNKQALIKILDERDYDPTIMLPFDQEKTLVHELIHLHMSPFDRKKEEDENELDIIAKEQAVECIAWGLVTVAREK